MELDYHYVVNLSLEIWASLMSLIMLFCLFQTNRMNRKSDRTFLAMLLLNLCAISLDIATMVFRGHSGGIAWLVMRGGIFLSFLAVDGLAVEFAWFLENFLERKMKRKPVFWYVQLCKGTLVFEALLLLLNLICPIFYRIDAENMYYRGKAFPLIFLPIFLSCILNEWMIWRYRSHLESWEKKFFLLEMGIPILSLFLMIFIPGIAYGYGGTTISLIILFIYLQAEEGRRMAEQENELLEDRMAMMVSQIQPHFVFNALNTIEYLCAIESPKSGIAVEKFASYLRENMDSIFNRALVPFSWEIQHLQNYLYIEHLRFPSIQVVYDLELEDFSLPPLSIQPLVENAIKHGVERNNPDSKIVIRSWSTEEWIYVSVTDNGVGFDPAKVGDDGKKHIGIENTRKRIELMTAGALFIESAPGRGTKAVIRIPAGEKPDRNRR